MAAVAVAPLLVVLLLVILGLEEGQGRLVDTVAAAAATSVWQ